MRFLTSTAAALLFSALFAVSTMAHSTHYYGVNRNESCIHPQPAKIFSYHLHLLYLKKNQQQVTDAYAIRDRFVAQFADRLGPDCHDLFHNNHTCMLDPDYDPAGPFPVSNWSVYILPGPGSNLEPMMQWLVQNRGRFSVLVHPNTGCEMEDHSDWTFWSGPAYPLDLDFFTHDEPYPQ